MSFLTWLDKLARLPVAEHHTDTLSELIINDQLQQLSLSRMRALTVAAVFRARQMNADTLASLPLRAGDTLVPAPNGRQDVQEFTAETILSMEDTGEAYWRIRDSDMEVLWPTDMRVAWNADRTRRLYRYRNDQILRTDGLSPNLIVISMNRASDELTGVGPMESSRIEGLIAEQLYSQEFFQANGNPTGILSTPGVLTKDEAATLKKQWVAARTTRSPAVLSGGMEWASTSFNPTDSEWTDTHMVGIGDVATLFGIPSVLLNYNQPGSSLTYKAIDDVYEGYWRETLSPTYARRIEAAWSGVIGNTVKFDPQELFIASLKERADAVGVLVRGGYDPAGSLEISGLPAIGHTGVLPVTVQQEDGGSDGFG